MEPFLSFQFSRKRALPQRKSLIYAPLSQAAKADAFFLCRPGHFLIARRNFIA